MHGLKNRYNRIPNLPFILLVVLFLIIVYFSYNLFSMDFSLDNSLARNILNIAMPVVGEQESHNPGWSYTVRSIVYLLTDSDLGNPKTFLQNSLPLLASIDGRQIWEERPFYFVPELSFAQEPTKPGTGVDVPVSLPEPQVLIYHTHSSEMYLGSRAADVSYRERNSHYVFSSNFDTKITGVMEVGNHLTQALRRQGIGVIHETKIHDWPSLTSSYLNSEPTVRELLTKHNTIELVFDIHRDADVPQPIVIINGQRVAKVLVVVGTAQDIPLAHPDWQTNLKFAQDFIAVGEKLYPGLIRPMQVRRDARYNQHLHSKSIIVEIGSVENTLEEALLAAELVATIIAQLL